MLPSSVPFQGRAGEAAIEASRSIKQETQKHYLMKRDKS